MSLCTTGYGSGTVRRKKMRKGGWENKCSWHGLLRAFWVQASIASTSLLLPKAYTNIQWPVMALVSKDYLTSENIPPFTSATAS